eukprot:CAMPEP_0183389596 /NCGR_PEP_ID=MMETSP0370-20130417/5023_1 /TAXON_ID=268820 /ORGANISM="Peridinium aciculiferum, Strain PAER-2" /LENGTH=87 /DNA_ID=CAMNT_0025568875 /DNA_START=261 /DNA_END=520 /DNA_ORIENTATION=-
MGGLGNHHSHPAFRNGLFSSRKHGILASDDGLQESEKSVHAGRGEEANAARTPGGVCCRRSSSPCYSRDLHEAHALDAILALLVDVL